MSTVTPHANGQQHREFAGAVLLDRLHTREPAAPSAPKAPARPVETAPVPKVTAKPRLVPASADTFSYGRVVGAIAIVLGAVALAAIGFVSSFNTVTDRMRGAFGGHAELVPIGIDVGILVFSGLDILLATMGMRLWWLRFIPWGLTTATIYLNISSTTDPVEQVAHAVLPALWVITTEVGAHVLRIRAGIAAGDHTESVGLVRLLVAPVESIRVWRWMVVKRIRTVSAAVDAIHVHKLARVALAERYGWKWAREAPGALVARYKQRELTADDVYDYVPPRTVIPAAARPTPVAVVTKSPKPRPKRTTARRGKAVEMPDDTAITKLRALPRDADGYVAVKAAAREIGSGVDRARRLLAAEGLLRPSS